MSDFDQKLGLRIRLLRQMKRISLECMGAALDVSTQQVQKYEAGSNRISPERLQKCADFLDVPIGYFFGTAGDEYAAETMVTAMTISEISSEDVRAQLYGLVKAIEKLSQSSKVNPEFKDSRKTIPLDAGDRSLPSLSVIRPMPSQISVTTARRIHKQGG